MALVLRIDDITPGMAWSRLDHLRAATERAGVKPLVGVVPECRDDSLQVEPPVDDFWSRIRDLQESGWALAQHGYRHTYDSNGKSIFGVAGKSEFVGHSYSEQERRLAIGQAIMRENRVWQPIFMAPNHSMDFRTALALQTLGFRFVTDGWGIFPYCDAGLLFVPQMFSKPVDPVLGVATICVHLNTMSDSNVDRLAWFIMRHTDRFITFEAATAMRPKWPIAGPVARNILRASVSAGRLIRSRLRTQ